MKINSKLGQWEVFHYYPENDLISYEVPIMLLPELYEAFTIEIAEMQKSELAISLYKDKTKVVLSIRLIKRSSKVSNVEKGNRKCWFKAK